jgi:hypothetical protein
MGVLGAVGQGVSSGWIVERGKGVVAAGFPIRVSENSFDRSGSERRTFINRRLHLFAPRLILP